jgi:hypothetical protein
LLRRTIVEDQAFAQRQVAQRQLLRAEPPQDRVDQHGAGHHQVRPARIEARQEQPLLDIQPHRRLAQPAEFVWP